jgi:homoserine O-succinyltransferase
MRVALVNSMPEAAMAGTERQFRELLQAAAPDESLDMLLFDVPEISRSVEQRARIANLYRPLDALMEIKPDVVVVTGADPGDKSLRDEAFWPSFARLVDWAVETERPTIWSCLAAHAAVDHLDGVERQRLPRKYSGVFTCAPTGVDPLLAGLGPNWDVPHSRQNDLSEAELVAAGYKILTRSEVVGVDSFVRYDKSLFLFCQGHLEYDCNSLALEYKRDFRSYLRGKREVLPEIPVGAFEPQAEQSLAALRKQAELRPSLDLMARWPDSPDRFGQIGGWRRFAVGLYRNWLRATL